MKALIQRTASVPRCPPRMARFGAGQLDLKGTGWEKKNKKTSTKSFPYISKPLQTSVCEKAPRQCFSPDS